MPPSGTVPLLATQPLAGDVLVMLVSLAVSSNETGLGFLEGCVRATEAAPHANPTAMLLTEQWNRGFFPRYLLRHIMINTTYQYTPELDIDTSNASRSRYVSISRVGSTLSRCRA